MPSGFLLGVSASHRRVQYFFGEANQPVFRRSRNSKLQIKLVFMPQSQMQVAVSTRTIGLYCRKADIRS